MIVLDYNATTPVHPEVISSMTPFFSEHWGNPSSKHALGKKASEAIEVARSGVANLIGAKPDEIIFTSGGTEATNLALFGSLKRSWFLFQNLPFHGIISSVIEHPATLESLLIIKARKIGFRLTRVLSSGRIDLDHFKRLMFWFPQLVSLIHAHNETGTIQPIIEASEISKKAGALVHVDASQSIGKIPVNVNDLGVDLLTIAGHKLGAPKGIGALFVREGVPLQRIICGAGQEKGLRGGTENVPYIVGLGTAARLAKNLNRSTVGLLRDELWKLLSKGLGENIRKFTDQTHNLPNTLFVALKNLDSASLLSKIPNLAASTGSACHDGNRMGSAVLRAMGVEKQWLSGTIRFSLGPNTTLGDIQAASEMIVDQTLKILRK